MLGLLRLVSILFRQASVFPPLMFIAQDPQIPTVKTYKNTMRIISGQSEREYLEYFITVVWSMQEYYQTDFWAVLLFEVKCN